MKIFKNVAILSLLLLSHLVSAHSGLKNSIPANGATLYQLPESVVLEFSMPVKLVKLKVIEQSGKRVKIRIVPSKQFKSNFSIQLPALEAGNYKVIWVTMGKDTHKMKGEFSFLINASELEKMPVNADGHNHQHN